MTMQILNADYWSSYLQPYVADLGVALVFGVGYYLFKQLHKDKDKSDIKGNLKEKIENHLNKWNQAKTIQKFNSLIITNTDRSTDAFKILNLMQKAEINPDIVTYNCLLDMSFKLEQREQAKKLFEEISDFTSPVQPDVVTFNILLKGCVAELREIGSDSMSAQEGLNIRKEILERVLSIVNDIKQRGVNKNEITYNTAIDAFIEGGDFNKAWEMYQEMCENESNIKPDLYTYATLIKGLKTNSDTEKNLSRAVEILNKIKSGEYENLRADEVLYNSVLDTCVKYNKVEMAENIFQDMKSQGVKPSLITFSIMIKGYGLVYKVEKALALFNEMKELGFTPNDIIYGCLLNCAVRCSRLDIMCEVYESMKSLGVELNTIIYTTLIKGFNKMKKFEKAFEIFDNITEKEKQSSNIVIYNAILDCCVESKNFEKLNEIYDYIKRKSQELENFPQPNIITYSTVIKGFAKNGKFNEAKDIYSFLKSNAYQLDEVLFNTVCDGFARANQNEMALQILKDMKEYGIKRTSVIYSILIKMYSNQHNEEKCLEMLNEMSKDNVKPSLVTYTTLMQMFIKKKKVLNAIALFQDMKKNDIKPDQVCYNFIVNGCTFNQKLERAIEFLLESVRLNIKLNEETYNNCLEYLLNNKFMKHHERVNHATEILKELKEKNFSINYDLYSRVARLIYKNNESNKEVESSLMSNFKNFSNLREGGANTHSKSIYGDNQGSGNNKQKETLQKQRKHYYNKY
jgi:pentatricopeptide repeat protein